MRVLDTADGIVFESRQGDLLLAEYAENKWSTSGPTWTVVDLYHVNHCGECEHGRDGLLYSRKAIAFS